METYDLYWFLLLTIEEKLTSPGKSYVKKNEFLENVGQSEKTLVLTVMCQVHDAKWNFSLISCMYCIVIYSIQSNFEICLLLARRARISIENPSDVRARVGDETVSELTWRRSSERICINIYSYSPRGHRRVLLFYFRFLIFFFYLYRIF